eukprot:4784484-Karenia_brevis.AAC.1
MKAWLERGFASLKSMADARKMSEADVGKVMKMKVPNVQTHTLVKAHPPCPLTYTCSPSPDIVRPT